MATLVHVTHDRCAMCGSCISVCPVEALTLNETRLRVDPACTGCGQCVTACPMGALSLDVATPSPSVMSCQAQYDVIVIGAGPAGSTAALAAAQAGASALLLEKRQEIGSPVRCAEGVSRVGLLPFIEPDTRWISTTVERARIIAGTPGSPVEITTEGGVGYVLERRVFDRVLAERAATAGVAVRVKSPALGLLTEGGRVAGVRARVGMVEREIAAAVVIGADGVESTVGRWAGLAGALSLRDQMTCAQYLLAGIEIDPTCLVMWIAEEFAPGGYVWLFPKGDGIANVGLGIQADLAREAPAAALDRFIDSTPTLSRGSPVNLVAGGVPVALPPARLVGDGVMLVGDAARQVDSLSGGGILTGMAAGQLAGQVAAAAVAAGDTSAERLGAYERTWREDAGRRLERTYHLRQKFPPGERTSRSFLRLFAVAAVGK